MKPLGILLLLFLRVYSVSYACVCELKPSIRTVNDLAEYSFLALVDIKNIDSLFSIDGSIYHRMKFVIAESFKGDALSSINVDGGHPSFKQTTSCDLGEHVGEQWIVFGRKDAEGRVVTGLCDRSHIYKRADGFRHAEHPLEFDALNQLRKFFDHEIVSRKDGERIEYYKNGNKELQETYRAGKLEGERKCWFPNGQLESKQFYKKGLRNGVFKLWNEQGQLTAREKFNKGKNIDTLTRWHESDTTHAFLKLYTMVYMVSMDSAVKVHLSKGIEYQAIYSPKGKPISRVAYSLNGKINNQSTYKGKFVYTTYYHEDGNRNYESVRKNDRDYSITEWDSQGKIKRILKFDKKGTVIK